MAKPKKDEGKEPGTDQGGSTGTAVRKEAAPAVVINRTRAAHSIPYTANPIIPSASTVILTLHPGVNLLQGEKAETWEKVRETPDVVRMLEARSLVVAVDSDGEELEENPSNLGKLDSAMAIELVQATVNTMSLQVWLQNEKRREVLDALREQVKRAQDHDRKVEETRNRG